MHVRILLAVLAVLVFAATAQAQEFFTLTSPVSQGEPDRVMWEVEKTSFHWKTGEADDHYEVEIILEDNNGRFLRCSYDGAVARADMITLNTANLTSNSLKNRILSRLTVVGGPLDGNGDDTPCIAPGTVTGIPE